MPSLSPPYFPYLYPRKKGRKMDYRNLAEEELKLRIAEQFFPTYDCAHRIGKIDFTVAMPVVRTQRDASGGPTRTAVRARGRAHRRHVVPSCGRSYADGGAGDKRAKGKSTPAACRWL